MRPPFNLSSQEYSILSHLNTPSKIQDFIETIPANFEPEGDTCLSPRRVLREHRAHCIEGAMLAAVALRLQNHPPLLMLLASTKNDFDHVVTPFKQHDHWGAISKSNHAVLRYRDPIYKNLRELAMSYIHEYTNDVGQKTMRAFSRPLNISRLDAGGWMTSEDNVWDVANALYAAPQTRLVTPQQARYLRTSDPIEQEMGTIVRWKKNTPLT